jgi:hypothetical protein
MTPDIHAARPTMLLLALALIRLAAGPAFATVGFAEWEVATPGGHRISHVDPLKERHGTCLRRADRQPGLISDDSADIFVDHVEWWTYYSGFVMGQARRGFFLFDETTAAVDYYATEQELQRQIVRRSLGTPLSTRRTAEDAWNETWLPVLRERCATMTRDGAGIGDFSQPMREAIASYCRRLGPP